MINFNRGTVFVFSVFYLNCSFGSPTIKTIKVEVDCPLVASNNKSLKKIGQNLYGEGILKYENKPQKTIWFNGVAIVGLNIPLNIRDNGYYNDGVSYNKGTGAIICKYNNNKGFDAFALTYILSGAANSSVYFEDPAKIKIRIPIKPK